MVPDMPPPRDPTIDIAKTIAIVAIVVGHVSRGLAGADIVDPAQTWYTVTDTSLYLFHLSCFALLSGCFVAQGVRRDGEIGYARSRIATFLYLYVVWSLLQGAVRVVAGDSTNTHVGVSDVLRLWRPESQLWFFGWLCVVTALAVLVSPWRSKARAVVAAVAAVVCSVTAWGWDGFYFGLTGLALTGFFALGVVRGTRPIRRLSHQAPRVLVVLVVLAATVFGLIQVWADPTEPTIEEPARTVTTILLGLLASCAGTLVVLAVAALLGKLPEGTAGRVAAPGRNSLAIFLAHIIAAAGSRILLVRLGVDDVVVHLVVGTAMGVGGPMLLLTMANRVGFPYLFQAPSRLTSRRFQPHQEVAGRAG
jgi:fucose 4-O-acetylase-like acetyltransferase